MRRAAAAALLGLCLAASCGAPAGDASKAAPAPAGAPMAPADDGDAADADGWAARVATAEAAVSRALGPRAQTDQLQKGNQKDKEKNESEALSEGDACSEACRALGSMRRATDRLCGLTGETDARCKGARSRTAEARGRVSAVCSCV